VFTGRKTWSPAHRRWLAGLRFAHPAQQIVLQEQIDTIEEAERRRDRLGQQIRELVPDWSMAPVVEAYQALRGVAFVTAVTFVAGGGAMGLDYLLWNRGQQPYYKARPRHRTRTVFY
jgi:transposase